MYMKRTVFVLALFCLATGAFALGLSAGVGASGAWYMTDIKTSNALASTEMLGTDIPITFLAFADITYAQLAVGFQMINGSHTTKTSTISGVTTTTDISSHANLRYLTFAGYGKLPIKLGPIVLFPMLGVEYDLTISGTDASGNDLTGRQKADFNEFWFKGGVGADIPITPKIYVRPELIFGYKLLSKPENDYVKFQKDGGNDSSILDLTFELGVLAGLRL